MSLLRKNIQPKLIDPRSFVPSLISREEPGKKYLRVNQLEKREKTIITDPSYFLSKKSILEQDSFSSFFDNNQIKRYLPETFSSSANDVNEFLKLNAIDPIFIEKPLGEEEYLDLNHLNNQFLLSPIYVNRDNYLKLKINKDKMFIQCREWDKKIGNAKWRLYDLLRDRVYLDPTVDKSIFMNRAAIKLANIDFLINFTAINSNAHLQASERREFFYADVAAGPGGFTEYIQYRIPSSIGYGITLTKLGDKAINESLLWNRNRLDVTKFNIFERGDGSGDLYRYFFDFSSFVLSGGGESVTTQNDRHYGFIGRENKDGLNLVTADGGFDIETEDDSVSPSLSPSVSTSAREKVRLLPIHQEFVSTRLILCEMMVAIETLQDTGNFICKIFDTVSLVMNQAIYLLSLCFKTISIFKPYSSRPNNAERYLICQIFKGRNIREVSIVHQIFDQILQLNYLNNELVKGKDIASITTNLIIPQTFIDWQKKQNDRSIAYQVQETDEILSILASDKIKIEYVRRIPEFRIPELIYGDEIYLPNFFVLWNIPESLKRARRTVKRGPAPQKQLKPFPIVEPEISTFPYLKDFVHVDDKNKIMNMYRKLLAIYNSRKLGLIPITSPVSIPYGKFPVYYELDGTTFKNFYASIIQTDLNDFYQTECLLNLFDPFTLEQKKVDSISLPEIGSLMQFFTEKKNQIKEKAIRELLNFLPQEIQNQEMFRNRVALDLMTGFSFQTKLSFDLIFSISCLEKLKQIGDLYPDTGLNKILDPDAGIVKILDPFCDWADRMFCSGFFSGVKNFIAYKSDIQIDRSDLSGIENFLHTINRGLNITLYDEGYLADTAPLVTDCHVIFTNLPLTINPETLIRLKDKFLASLRVLGFCILYLDIGWSIGQNLIREVKTILLQEAPNGSKFEFFGHHFNQFIPVFEGGIPSAALIKGESIKPALFFYKTK